MATNNWQEYRGLSTETKPTHSLSGGPGTPLNVGDTFTEIDTGTAYDWNGTAWIVSLISTGGGGGGGSSSLTGTYLTADPTLTNGATASPRIDVNQIMLVHQADLVASKDTVSVTSLAQMAGVAIAMGTGVRSGGTQRVTIATDDVIPASQSGTWNVATVTTVTAVSDAQVQGKAAHDAAVSGNPVLVGATGRRARMTAVAADGNVVRLAADRYGRQQVAGIDLTALALQVTASGDTPLIPAPGAGSRIKLMRVEASNSSATVALTAGLKSTSLNGGAVFGKRYLPAAGGAGVWNFPGGHLMCGDNEALSFNLSGIGQVEATAYYEIVAT